MPPSAYTNFPTNTTASSIAAVALNAESNNMGNTKIPNTKRGVDNSLRYQVVDEICQETNLYNILGIERTATAEELRKAYITRSRICHPDKFPGYPKATEAFQKLSYAYETLNKPSSRRAYDVSGSSDLGSASGMGDETLHGVLYQLFLEFMDGDFEMIRALVNALNEGNPSLDLGDDAIENLEHAFRRMRELLLAGQKYIKIVQFELMRVYDLQQELRSLSYFDVFGRLRLTLQLARLTLSIPMLIDQAMKHEFAVNGGKGKYRGLLGDGMAKVLAGLVTLLERGEKFV
ncbi:11944_t:CDS:2 [Ambispora gerdemannii]|uniref:11944_t:CDS:1 n=1 Tax=Ambispora gerdemannii TaxID=144530 RepID=A0A9N9B9C3_9GLOM|nr:11944_t:CDS:2 [Ambispora gerdemannii]